MNPTCHEHKDNQAKPSLQNFLIPILDYGQEKKKTWQVQDKNSIRFYCKMKKKQNKLVTRNVPKTGVQ